MKVVERCAVNPLHIDGVMGGGDIDCANRKMNSRNFKSIHISRYTMICCILQCCRFVGNYWLLSVIEVESLEVIVPEWFRDRYHV